MAEFTVTLSEMTQSASKVREYCQNFKDAADKLKSATNELTSSSEGWDSEASKVFNENIEQAHKWLTQMSELVNEFAKAIDQSRETYQTTDETSAKLFK